MRYDERKLHSVTIGVLDLIDGEDEKLASTTVYVNLTAYGHDDMAGPSVQINLGVPSTEEDTLAHLRDQAVHFAYEMIQRLAAEPLDSFVSAARKAPLYRSIDD